VPEEVKGPALRPSIHLQGPLRPAADRAVCQRCGGAIGDGAPGPRCDSLTWVCRLPGSLHGSLAHTIPRRPLFSASRRAPCAASWAPILWARRRSRRSARAAMACSLQTKDPCRAWAREPGPSRLVRPFWASFGQSLECDPALAWLWGRGPRPGGQVGGVGSAAAARARGRGLPRRAAGARPRADRGALETP
jgi:hypothetical protein